DLNDVIAKSIHPDDREKVNKANETIINDQKFSSLEYRVVWPDGSVHTVWMEPGEKVLDENGLILRLKGIVQDISERKIAEAALYESDKRYRLISENSGDVIWTLNLASQHFTYVSPSVYRLRGLTPEEVMAEPMEKAMTPESSRMVMENLPRRIQAYMAGDESARTNIDDVIQVHRDGSNIPTEVVTTLVANEVGQVVEVIGVSRDISSRRQTEEERERIFNLVPDLICIASTDGYFKKINPAWEMALGFTTNELLSTPFVEFIHPDDVASTFAEVQKQVNGNRTFSFINRYRCKNGKYKWFEWVANPSPDGTLLYAAARDITERKQTEEQVNILMERFELAARAAHLGVWDWDIENDRLTWDDRMYDLYGTNKKTFSGAYETWLNGLHPEDRASSDEISQQALRGEKEYDTEFRVIWPDGTVRWLKAYGQVIRNSDGKPLRMIGINFDISAQKSSIDALARMEDRYRKIMIATPDNIILLDEDMLIQYINHVSPGLNEKEVLGSKWLDWLELADRTRALKAFEHTLNTGEGTTIEFRANGLDRKMTWFEVKFALVPGDKNREIVLVAHDITERRQFDEALRKSEEQYRLINNASQDSIYSFDMDDRFTSANRHLCEELKLSPEEIIGKTPSELGFPESRCNDLAEMHKKVLETNRTHVFEGDTPMPDGQVHVFELTMNPLHDSESRIVGIAETSRDITDIKRAEVDNRLLSEQLLQAQKMESVGQLAGGVAHDFNNLLGVIIGHSEIALNKISENDPTRVYFKEIFDAAQRSADLTRQLLAYARKQTINPKVLDLNGIVNSMLMMLQRMIGEDIDLVWNPGEGKLTVKIDPTQVDQVLANLIVNARDAIKDVGKITIETGRVEFDREYCSRHAEVIPGIYIMLAVSDNGTGMDRETQSHLFEPFFTTKSIGEGTGLGLATVFGIVKQNNGFINVYSEPQKGTTIKIYLPRFESEVVADPYTEVSVAIQGEGEIIMIVEDELALLDLCRDSLEDLGYNVLAANTPGEAILLAEEHAGSIQLLITDVVMPEMNGRDLASKLLAISPGIKIMFTSGYTANVIAHRGVLDQGVNFIQKPYLIKDLAAKVREVLTQK
ncbi:MAG: PAS domain S-box protein, partial [Chloroflexota bacterium]